MENVSAGTPLVRVVIHNDDLTPFDFVTSIIVGVFDLCEAEAIDLALRAERQGSATLAILPADLSEALVAKARDQIAASAFPLSLSLEKAEHGAQIGSIASVPLVSPGQLVQPSSTGAPFMLCFTEALRSLRFHRERVRAENVQAVTLVGIAALSILVQMIAGWINNGELSLPRVSGLTSAIASLGLLACGLLLLSGSRKSFDVTAAFAIILCIAILLSPPFLLLTELLLSARGSNSVATAWWGFSLLLFAWWIAAIAWFGARLMPLHRFRGAIGLLAVASLSSYLLPNRPLVPSMSNYGGSPGLIEYAFDLVTPAETDEYNAPAPLDVEETYARQHALVNAAVDGLLPSREDRGELYFVSFGAYAGQGVFLREATSARALFDSRMGTEGRSLLLVNNRETVDELPLANVSNLELVMERLGNLIKPDKDVAVLFLTSHGSQQALSVSFGGFSFNDLTPQRLKEILDRAKIRHRVVIVSACHSGAFIPALKGRNTLIIIAARADRSSFGCSDERDWTYFGDAFFNHALRETRSLVEAFRNARERIQTWETRDGYEPSEPQISGGEDVLARLQQITKALDAAQGVPVSSEALSREANADVVR